MTSQTLGIIVLVVVLLADALLAASKAALVNAPKQTLRERAEAGDRRAARALSLSEEGVRMLATTQVGAVLFHFVMAGLVVILWVPRLADVLGRVSWLAAVRFGLSSVIAILASSFLLYLLGEMLPELFAARYADRLARRLAGPMRLAMIVFAPFASGAQAVGNLLAKSGAPGAQGNLPFVTEEEILTLVDAGEEEGVIEQDEKQMIASIFKLDNTLVREVMVPRIDMVALSVDTPLKEALDVVIKAGHSRIPVFRDNIDAIAGLLYAKDLLEVWRDGKTDVDLEKLLRDPLFVPESKKLDDLLKELQHMKVHMALVVDEYGGTAGIVTIEDIVEEIVGEIQDEYDSEEVIYRMVGDDEFIFDARIDIDDLNEVLACDLPTELGDTLGGFIYSRLGKVPVPGEQVIADGLHLEVLSVDEQRIQKVRIRRLPPEPPGDDPQGNHT